MIARSQPNFLAVVDLLIDGPSGLAQRADARTVAAFSSAAVET
jgi:hypothetical protein